MLGGTRVFRRDQVQHTPHQHARLGHLSLDGSHAFLLLGTARVTHRRLDRWWSRDSTWRFLMTRRCLLSFCAAEPPALIKRRIFGASNLAFFPSPAADASPPTDGNRSPWSGYTACGRIWHASARADTERSYQSARECPCLPAEWSAPAAIGELETETCTIKTYFALL